MERLVGFVWIILLICTGPSWEDDVNECDLNPCQNGGLCENYLGGYTCHCSLQSQDGRQYGGQNCTKALLGCEGHACQNGATCLPLLTHGEHGHLCACPPGFTGSECQTSTTFSFETGGHLLQQRPNAGPDASWYVTFSFRTKIAHTALFLRRASEFDVCLVLAGGRPRLHIVAGGGKNTLLEVLCNLSDGEWHTIEIVFESETLRVRLLDGSCAGEGERTLLADSRSQREGSGLGGELLPTFHTTFIGGVEEDWSRTRFADGFLRPFVGCLQDVWVDSQLVVPGDWLNGKPVNATHGCSIMDRCEDHPCLNRGRCVSQWMSYRCECYRPYDGPDCSEEHIAARFGSAGQVSYAVFTVGRASLEGMDMTMFVRTRSRGALLLALANSTGVYLQLWLEEGRPVAQTLDSEILRGGATVNDGRFHLLHLSVRSDRMTLYQSAQVQGSTLIRGVRVEPGNLIYVGGLPMASFSTSFGGYLRGCVQDLRVGDHRLQFFPLEGMGLSSYRLVQLVNVTFGCTGDDTCRSNPCLNGGVCYPLWDDFTCTCPPSTSGQRCEDVMWCELSPCPTSTICLPLTHGFECISDATFQEDSDAISFRGNGIISRSLTSIAFRIRTRSHNASILKVEKGLQFLAVFLWNSRLHLELRSGISSLVLSMRSQIPLSDGHWHSITLSMVTPSSETSQWTMEIDGQGEPSVSEVATGNLDFLKEGADLILGGGGLVGCLSTVDIGGITLPFQKDEELHLPRPQRDQFLRSSAGPVLLGCWGSPVCDPDPCLNGGYCVDLFNLARCDCGPDWVGPLCELSSDPCTSSPCVHGNCSALALEYICVCELGYTGRDCTSQEEKDPCEFHLCAWGATCLRGYSSYTCLCPPDKTGHLCDAKFKQVPWYEEHYPRQVLPVSVCGGEHWNYTCYNGGNCTQTGLQWACNCTPGFTGHWCETDIDECFSNPCFNGGYCINMIDTFHCVCKAYFNGELCEIPVSDLHFYIFLLLWQNLFQLLSYMVLRMDDEPEIDWWFNED